MFSQKLRELESAAPIPRVESMPLKLPEANPLKLGAARYLGPTTIGQDSAFSSGTNSVAPVENLEC
jgi:hypothetical protein